MCSLRLTLLFALLLIFVSPLPSDEKSDDEKRLVGTWQATTGTWDGKALTAEQARACVLSITASEPARLQNLPMLDLKIADKVVGYKAWVGDNLQTHYVTSLDRFYLALDPSHTPRGLSASKQDGLKRRSFSGIYRIDGKSLTVAFNLLLDKSKVLPPREFTSAKGSEVLVLTMKRGK